MNSMYTPQQRRILRIVEGAVRNAVHSHPGVTIPAYMPRSIAKRAAGTLSSQWLEVLAANMPSKNGAISNGPGGTASCPSASAKRGVVGLRRHSPLLALVSRISSQIKPMKKAGQTEKAEAMVEVLRMIHELRQSRGEM